MEISASRSMRAKEQDPNAEDVLYGRKNEFAFNSYGEKAPAGSNGEIDIYVIAGQSNAVGYGRGELSVNDSRFENGFWTHSGTAISRRRAADLFEMIYAQRMPGNCRSYKGEADMNRIIYESETDRKNHLLFMKRDIKTSRFTSGTPYIHGSIELLFGLSGRSEVIIDGKVHDITEGRIIFLRRFQKHNFNYLSGSQFYVVVISSDFFDGMNNLGRLSFPTIMEKNESFGKIKAVLDTCYAVRNTDSVTFKSGLVNLLISVLCENYPHSVDSEQRGIYDVLTEILDYINENFRNDLSVSEIAGTFGYSPNYFSTLFNKHVGMSFREYLNRRRMSEYVTLRKTSPELPSYKAAEISGFRNLSSFYDTLNKMKKDSDIKDYDF